MKLRLICCEVMFREVCALLAGAPHRCDVEFIAKGLHDLGVEKMRPRLQERIDAAADGGYDAILLAYGLCNNGTVGLKAPGCRLVVPRAHDCITLFMGSREKYRDYFHAHPGTYYRTTGWYERDDSAGAGDITVSQKLGLFMKYEELVQKYGEENAKYVMETMGDATANYDRLAFIRMGLEAEEPYRKRAMEEARERGWTYDEVQGSMEILRKLVYGEWDGDFLVLEAGESVEASHDDGVVRRGVVNSKQ